MIRNCLPSTNCSLQSVRVMVVMHRRFSMYSLSLGSYAETRPVVWAGSLDLGLPNRIRASGRGIQLSGETSSSNPWLGIVIVDNLISSDKAPGSTSSVPKQSPSLGT